MSRAFSTTARTLLHFIWKGTDAVSKYEAMISDKVAQNSKLKAADKVEVAGGEHSSPKDKVDRVSGQIYKGATRLTSVHAYADGRLDPLDDGIGLAIATLQGIQYKYTPGPMPAWKEVEGGESIRPPQDLDNESQGWSGAERLEP